jgi:hypothetical protein
MTKWLGGVERADADSSRDHVADTLASAQLIIEPREVEKPVRSLILRQLRRDAPEG